MEFKVLGILFELLVPFLEVPQEVPLWPHSLLQIAPSSCVSSLRKVPWVVYFLVRRKELFDAQIVSFDDERSDCR